ncbi:MAG TPA: hypothetical protein VGA13_12745, partial [Acidimicrobiales bacterium]
ETDSTARLVPPKTRAVTVDDPPQQWRELALLATPIVLSMTTWFSASAVLPQLKSAWGLSTAAGSWPTIAVQIGFVAGAVASASLGLADRINPRRLIFIGAAAASAANAALVVSDGIETAIPLRLATGARR